MTASKSNRANAYQGARVVDKPCACSLCEAMLALAADIDHNLRAEREARKLRLIPEQPRRRKATARE